MNWSLIDFFVMSPKWFIAMWVALIAGSLWLLWTGMTTNWSDDDDS